MWIFFLGEWFLKSVEWKILIPFNAGFFKNMLLQMFTAYMAIKTARVTESVDQLSGKIYLLSGKQSN